MTHKLLLSVTLWLTAVAAVAASYTGRVVDAAGQPVPFATVYLKNDPVQGTATGNDGRFVLEVSDTQGAGEEVIISFIGYEKQAVRLGDLSGRTIELREQPIALQETVVEVKHHRQPNKRKQMAKLLYEVYQQMERDMPKDNYRVQIVSDVTMDAQNTPWGMEQMIATVVQMPSAARSGKDSVQLRGDYCKRFFQGFLRTRADSVLAGNKMDKRLRRVAVEMDSGVVVHKELWKMGTVHRDFEEQMNDIKNWKVSKENDGLTVLTYRLHKNYILFRYEVQQHYIVDSRTYRLHHSVLEGSADVTIPFGYKLKPGDLEILNLINMDTKAIDKFRLRKAHLDMHLNTLYQHPSRIYPLEKNMRIDAQLTGTKKQEIPVHIKATQRVTRLETEGVRPWPRTPSRRVKRENVTIY